MRLNEFSFSGIALAELMQATFTKGASFKFQVKGFSMSPFIKDGDVVTISPALNSSLGFGKSVAFIHPETKKLVIHRIVGKNWTGYLIKGDSATKIDGLIPRESILGVVTRVERKNKEILLGLGLERFIIAFLSKTRLLPFIFWSGKLIPVSIRRLVL